MEHEFWYSTIIIILLLVFGIFIILVIAAVSTSKIYRDINKGVKDISNFFMRFEDEFEEIKPAVETVIDAAKVEFQKHKGEISQITKELPLMIEDGIQQLQERLQAYRAERLQYVQSQNPSITRTTVKM